MFSLVIILILLGLFILKNENACKNRCMIIDAIFEHHICVLKTRTFKDQNSFDMLRHFEVDYNDAEPYGKTLFRLYDWGCTRILPKEKYEIIKPYIKESKK